MPPRVAAVSTDISHIVFSIDEEENDVSPATNRTTCRTTDPTGITRTADHLPCRRADPDLWFAESPDSLERAKQLCAHCPVRSVCLDAALDRAEPWGVWGGEIFDQGVVIARKRSRGRPRKNPVTPAPAVCA